MHGVLVEQLDRELYVRTNKALEAMGGKWNRSAKAHVFTVDPRPRVDDLLENGTLTVERDGFSETPMNIVERMISLAGVKSGDTVLEPSAGMGAIAKCIREANAHVFCIEKNSQRAKALLESGYVVNNGDFLEVNPEHDSLFDAVIMNPPFEELQDVAHVMHAYEFLKRGGTLVSVIGESAFFRDDTKAKNFREWLDAVGGYSEKLPESSFKESGTNVNARLVVINKV